MCMASINTLCKQDTYIFFSWFKEDLPGGLAKFDRMLSFQNKLKIYHKHS